MQLTYSQNPAVARAGMLYDDMFSDVVTRYCAASRIPFGTIVAKNTGDGNVKPLDASGNSIEGLLMFSQFVESGPTGDGLAPGIAAGTPLNILRKGRIWVYSETAFNPDSDTLYARITANGANYVGRVRNDSDSGKAIALASGFAQAVTFKVLNTLTGAGFLAIDISIP